MSDPLTAEQIGQLAINAERAKRAVQRWMSDQGKEGILVQADQAPMWGRYQECITQLAAALMDVEN